MTGMHDNALGLGMWVTHELVKLSAKRSISQAINITLSE